MKSYDRTYFDKWYRSPQHRVGSRAQLARKVATETTEPLKKGFAGALPKAA